MRVGAKPPTEEKPLLPVEGESGSTQYLVQVGERVHVPLHLLELQVAVGNQGDTERTGLTLSCTTYGERLACFSARSQAASSHLPAEETALIAVVVVRLQEQLVAVPGDGIRQIDGFLVVGCFGGGHQPGPGHAIVDRLTFVVREFDR